MARSHPMNLLLQGDVGSGKTLVALHAALLAIGSGHQAAIMAPTEVLAGQHARSMEALLGPIGARPYLEARTRRPPTARASLFDRPDAEDAASVTYALLTAAVTGKDRAAILDGVASGEVDLVVGTHALVQEAVSFADLSLAVIDEQHRFGVHQRMALKGKGAGGRRPDVLIMTATPIPRTLALTYYGDLDVVVLDEMPKGAGRSRRASRGRGRALRRLPSSSARRWRPAARRSWCAPRSTRATGPRSAPRRPRPSGSRRRSSRTCPSSSSTAGCARPRRNA